MSNTRPDPASKGPEQSTLLSWSEVRARVLLSRATVWALRRRGAFPAPIQISPNRIAWRESDLNDWIADRAASRSCALSGVEANQAKAGERA